ncbi:hypothetical protein GDO81_011656 [Engystomops pustulosus]|uniref:Glyoxylate reductase/hydroxypyruvate reductase n=1 Tax=Engystomops pustulosus TaxID=76066 RepID=A0AAV7BFT9_ENGPU|nr:hypothetical protein GDO81_011656 [Engystomops pustulosus]
MLTKGNGGRVLATYYTRQDCRHHVIPKPWRPLVVGNPLHSSGCYLCCGAHQIAVSPNTVRFHANWVGGDITGMTLGIVGMGRIGYKIAQRAKAFEMKILYHNRHRRPEEEKSVGASYCERLDDLLQQSDYVMLVVNLSPETEKLMGKHEFQMMKPSAMLINISRGLVVDQEALVEALETGQIKAAALDVTYPEPLPRDHPLLKMSNVVLAPHMGTATREITHF